MQHNITCDEVFDLLTCAPFPSGDVRDEAVERHLGACHDCRCLAEGLRPAVELFHETIESEAREELPLYAGQFAVSAATRQKEQSRAACPARHPRVRRREARAAGATAWAIGTSIVVLLVLGVSLTIPTVSRDNSGPTVADTRDRNIGPDEDGRQKLALLELPEDCRFVVADALRETSSRYRCCTECHTANSPRPSSSGTIALLASSCGTCHVNRDSEDEKIPENLSWFGAGKEWARRALMELAWNQHHPAVEQAGYQVCQI